MQSKDDKQAFSIFSTYENLNYWGKIKTSSFHTDHRAHTNALFPKSTCKLIKCKMHNAGIYFLFLNVDVIQKESCCITLNSISSESKQACPKSKDTLRFTCFDTRNI